MTLAKQLANFIRFGYPGDPVAGSQFVRAYCVVCGEPIRVTAGAQCRLCECDDCRGGVRNRVHHRENLRLGMGVG